MKQHLLRVVAAGRPVPQQLRDQPEFPTRAQHLWELFCDLSTSRRTTMGGVMPLGYPEFFYRQAVTGERLTSIELDVVKRIDHLYMLSQIKAQKNAG